MTSQPQLLQMALKPGDDVYTPAWVAEDMVEYFLPAGKVLDPCRGGGAFERLIKDCLWCEIEEGKDFFAWHETVDWIIGNPPFSTSIILDWMKHSYSLAPHIVYLLPMDLIFRSPRRMRLIKQTGWIKQIRFYGSAGKLGFPFGNPVGAFHFVRGYCGPTEWTWHAKSGM